MELTNYLNSVYGLAFLNTSRQVVCQETIFIFMVMFWICFRGQMRLSGYMSVGCQVSYEVPLPRTSSGAGQGEREGPLWLLPESHHRSPALGAVHASSRFSGRWQIVTFSSVSPQLQPEFLGTWSCRGGDGTQWVPPGSKGTHCSWLYS